MTEIKASMTEIKASVVGFESLNHPQPLNLSLSPMLYVYACKGYINIWNFVFEIYLTLVICSLEFLFAEALEATGKKSVRSPDSILTTQY
jgi:hypothetical protein